MRVRLNRSLKTKNKTATEHGAYRQTEIKKSDNIKNGPDMTELIIQIAFIIAVETAIFISFNTLHIATLIILFKCLTNFPKERNHEEKKKNLNPKKLLRNWKKRKYGWRHTKCLTKLVLAALLAIHLVDSITKHSDPENPKHTFKRLLYSLAHDTTITNNSGTDVPIKPATMTTNRTKIRKDLKKLLNLMNSIFRNGKKFLDNVANVRSKTVRNITMMILKVWTFLLRANKGTKNTKEKTKTYWSPKNCGECDICQQRGPQSLCPYCNIELLGFINFLKINGEIIFTLPRDIMKIMAWTSIKSLLINVLDEILANMTHLEMVPLMGLIIRIRTSLNRLISNTPKENKEQTSVKKKVKKNKRRKSAGKHRRKNKNLKWHHRHKEREALKESRQKPRTRNIKPKYMKENDTIAQYDGNDDIDSDTEYDDTPLENVLTSTYGWRRTTEASVTKAFDIKMPEYPKGIRFWSDPNSLPDEIIWEDPPPSDPPNQNRDFVWKNESDEEEIEDIEIPDAEYERTEIMTINVRSCYGDVKRMEVQDGILDANPDVVIVTETWLLEGDQDLTVPGYIPIIRCDRKNMNGKRLSSSERGGGVLVLAKDYITITESDSHKIDKYIQVVTFIMDKVTIFGVYRSPKALKENHQKLTKFLEQQLNNLGNRPFVITGDINLGDLAEQDFDPDLTPVGAETENGTQVRTTDHMWTMLLKKHQIEQHVDEPTCQTGKILDYVFAPDYLDVPKIRVDRHFGLPGTTDHYAVIFEIDSYFQRSREEVFKRKESKKTWREFHALMPSQMDIVENMPSEKDGLTGQTLIDAMSSYIIDILTTAYERATPLVKVKPPPRGGYLSKTTKRQLKHSKKLWRVLTLNLDDVNKLEVKAKLKVLSKSNRWNIRKDREAWEMRRLHLAEDRHMNLYKFMNAINYKIKTLGPIMADGKLKTSDKDMSDAYNNFLCDLMTPSTPHNIDWDTNHEPIHAQLYLAAIPGSETMKPLENEEVYGHILRLHQALIKHGYVPKVGDIIDGYPLGTQSRGQKGLPIAITYKDRHTKDKVKAASIKAGLWNDRKRRSDPNCPKGFFTAAYENLQDMEMLDEEIRDAISSSNRNSAAGPDGVKMSVFKEAEETVIVPLRILFNTINRSGLIPANFKTAKVIMIHKKNSKQEMGNYRPISMSNHISKVWERAFNKRLMKHLKRHNRLSRQQHGFRPKMGCHTNLLEAWEQGIDMTDEHGPEIELWSFDLQKAFDLLDHGKSLKLCHKAGIGGNTGRCLQSWLTKRKQFVQCGKERSRERFVNRSCIQGSVLGPTLWIIYIQSLLDRLENRCNYYAYADDVTLIAKIGSDQEIEDFNEILRILLAWGEEFSMTWGAHKTQRMAMRYHKCKGDGPPTMTFDGKNIEVSETMESLGMILCKGGIGYGHLTKIKDRIAATRTLIWKNYRIRTQDILEKLYITYIVPQINYCSTQYNTNNESHLRELETELRKFWKMSQTKSRPPKFMGLREQLIFNDLKQLHQMFHGRSTIDFDDFFKISEIQKRTDEQISKKKSIHAFAKYTFGRRVQKYWNLLPLETRYMGRERFKDEVKLILTHKDYEQLRNKMLNFGRSQPIQLPPGGINQK